MVISRTSDHDKILKRLGVGSALTTAVLTVVTLAVALLIPPAAGPLALKPVSFQYFDFLSHFPRDYIWMYPAMLLMLSYIVMVGCIYLVTPSRKRVWAHMGLAFGAISGAVLFLDYLIQVSIIQQSLFNENSNVIRMLTQFNPRSIFVVMEEIGYMFMSLSFLFTASVFYQPGKLDKAVKGILYTAFFLGVGTLAAISMVYGMHREYIFEVAAISINFLALIPVGILIGLRFRRFPEGTAAFEIA